MAIPPNEFPTRLDIDAGGEPDQAMGNRTTDFNPDWIWMIVRLV